MAKSDGFLRNSEKIEKTRIVPLRWVGNFFGDIATSNLLMAMHYDDHDDHGFAYRYHAFLWKYLNKPYEWWGTYYTLDMESWK